MSWLEIVLTVNFGGMVALNVYALRKWKESSESWRRLAQRQVRESCRAGFLDGYKYGFIAARESPYATLDAGEADRIFAGIMDEVELRMAAQERSNGDT